MSASYYFLLLSLFSGSVSGQISYTGTVGKYKVEMVTDIYSDGVARAIYAYTSYNEPIELSGNLEKGKLTLYEKSADQKDVARFDFSIYDAESEQLKGTWTNLKTKKILPVTLNKTFEVIDGNDVEWHAREMLQPVSIGDKYFKLVVTKDKDIYYTSAIAVKVLEKKTGKLLQLLDVECQLLGIENIDTGDYNFDGYTDFSVFETSYAGPNTSSLYFLYDPKTDTFFDSGFEGVSFEFDSDTKTVSERNVCCAGTSITTTIYRVVNNQLIMQEQHCFKWDEDTEELVERKWEECE